MVGGGEGVGCEGVGCSSSGRNIHLETKSPQKNTKKKKRHKELQSLYSLHGGLKLKKFMTNPDSEKKEKEKNL